MKRRAEEEWPVPSGVRDLLEARIAGLPELPAQVLAAAAVLGSFDTETVRDTSGRGDEETVRALEDLVAAGLLAETGEGSYEQAAAHTTAIEHLKGSLRLARVSSDLAAETAALRRPEASSRSRRAPPPPAAATAVPLSL